MAWFLLSVSNLIDHHKSHNYENWVAVFVVVFSNMQQSLNLKTHANGFTCLGPHMHIVHTYTPSHAKRTAQSPPPAAHRKTHKPSFKGHNRAPIHNFSALCLSGYLCQCSVRHHTYEVKQPWGEFNPIFCLRRGWQSITWLKPSM